MGKKQQQIRDSQLQYKQGLGQNFIYDDALLVALVEASGVGKGDRVLEIGPGCGTMTVHLARACQKVIALELDERLIPLIKRTLRGMDNVLVVQGDVLKEDLGKLTAPLGPGFSVVANIPYYITSPILNLFLDSGLTFSRLAMMVQTEVAEKMLARPGTDGYGMLSVKCQYYGTPQIAAEVPAACFTPRPKVDSAFVVMPMRERPAVSVKNPKVFFRVAGAAFAMRRKTMANNLQAAFAVSKGRAEELLASCGLDARVRGEKLGLEEFAALADKLA